MPCHSDRARMFHIFCPLLSEASQNRAGLLQEVPESHVQGEPWQHHSALGMQLAVHLPGGKKRDRNGGRI